MTAMKIKMDLDFAAFLCFKTLRVAGKGPDRSYAPPVPLAHLKNAFLSVFHRVTESLPYFFIKQAYLQARSVLECPAYLLVHWLQQIRLYDTIHL